MKRLIDVILIGLNKKVNVMKSLRFISSKVIKNLIEGQVDIITKKAEQDEAFYMRQTCPRCKGTCRKIGNP
ncbi:MAG: hypothetical protein ACFFFC_00005, partial [Candidatus Thorarchaeota archaeon]